jgi:hypothetical protein
MGAREIHDGDEPCRRRDRLDHFAFEVGERCTELLPEPGRPAGTCGLPRSGVVISEVGVVFVLEWQRRIPHPCEGVEGRLPTFGYLGRHEHCPFSAAYGSPVYTPREAPEVGNKVATLAQYTITPPAGIGDFDNAGVLSAVVSTGTPTYAGANLNYQNDSGVMIQSGAQVSTPGDPDVPLTAFNAAYGSALPATPAG